MTPGVDLRQDFKPTVPGISAAKKSETHVSRDHFVGHGKSPD
jgi:hypothetical protein